jgi:hypothetical protein
MEQDGSAPIAGDALGEASTVTGRSLIDLIGVDATSPRYSCHRGSCGKCLFDDAPLLRNRPALFLG